MRSKVEALNERRDRHNLAQQPPSATTIVDDVEVFVEGDGRFAQRKHLRIDNASGGKNVLSVAFLTFSENNLALVLCGGVDGKDTNILFSQFKCFILCTTSYICIR